MQLLLWDKGKIPTVLKKSAIIQERPEKKYNPEKITLTGHSLGVYLSSHVGDKNDEVLTYNKLYNGGAISNKVTHYRVKSDPVSIFSTATKHTNTLMPTESENKSTRPVFLNGLAQYVLTALGNHDLRHIQNKPIIVG